jgi:DNA-binding NtrC family response regulator
MPEFYSLVNNIPLFWCLAIKLPVIAIRKHLVVESSSISPPNPAFIVPMGDLNTSKPYALIIDDEVDICYLLKGILKHKNIDAQYVTSLSEAEEFLRNDSPPLIFLDNHLPDGRGVDFIRQFKTQLPSSTIIMITAHDTSADREKAFNEGVDFFIGKPFTREIIIKTVEKIISVE